MPELPEVETIVRGLQKSVVNRKIKSIEVLVNKLFIGNKNTIIDSKIVNVIRLGKTIVIQFENNYLLQIHLKMTGQLIFIENCKLSRRFNFVGGGHPDKKYNQLPPHKYTHIIINFYDDSTLYYNDLRKFGWMKIILDSRIKNLESKLGIDALSKKLSPKYFANKIKNKKTTIKQALLDQTIIAGIGNIYSDEILFCAKILPGKKVSQLNSNEIIRIVKYIPIILNKSIKFGGTSKSDYLKIDGTRGDYLNHAFAYGREGKPCRVCKSKIIRIKIGQRSSHFCPKCQSNRLYTS